MSSGNILRGEDGSLYFIRDEVLAACKVEGEYVDRVEKLIAGSDAEVEGFGFTSTSMTAQPVAYVSGTLLSTTARPGRMRLEVASTIMCPW